LLLSDDISISSAAFECIFIEMNSMKIINRYLLLQIFCLLTAISACAQVKNNVVKIHSYWQETVAGNVEVDSNGNQVNSGVDGIHLLFAETTGKYVPSWNVVYTNKGVFAVQQEEIKTAKYEVGKLKSNSRTVTIAAKRGNRLWQLTLIPMKARIPKNIAAILKKNAVVVITEWNNKQFTHTIAKEIELETVFYK
jgi:hypothetical protein